MTTICCLDCSHIVLVRDGRGRCSHCGAEYEVEIRQVKKSPLEGDKLDDRRNMHRG
jgi:DNA-directed RNA polymerase subunit M/transcription elongation factor TFIIS